MATVAAFRRDLFVGTAEYYERYRVPYPSSLIEDLSEQASLTGSGTLLDLACGTGQLTFALHERFARTWAVDQEPGMIEVVARKAAAIGEAGTADGAGTAGKTGTAGGAGTAGGGIRAAVGRAEELPLPAASLDLAVIGNAFHRFPRDVVAGLLYGWLRPGGHLALVWGGGPEANPPSDGLAPWQEAMHAVLARWRPPGRIPASYERDRAERPDVTVLTDAGFEYLGKREYSVAHEWTTESLLGHAYSTSGLSRAALGDAVPEFEADLRRALLPHTPFRHRLSFACELSVRPDR